MSYVFCGTVMKFMSHTGRGVFSSYAICTLLEGHLQTQTCNIIVLLTVIDCCVHVQNT